MMLRDQLIVGVAFLVPVSLIAGVVRSLTSERTAALRPANARTAALAAESDDGRRINPIVASQNAA